MRVWVWGGAPETQDLLDPRDDGITRRCLRAAVHHQRSIKSLVWSKSLVAAGAAAVPGDILNVPSLATKSLVSDPVAVLVRDLAQQPSPLAAQVSIRPAARHGWHLSPNGVISPSSRGQAVSKRSDYLITMLQTK